MDSSTLRSAAHHVPPPTASPSTAERSFDNDVEFRRTHRGLVERRGDTYAFRSARARFRVLALGHTPPPRDWLHSFDLVHRRPWSTTSAHELATAGFVRVGGVSFIRHVELVSRAFVHPMTIEVVRTAEATRTFTDAQARCFPEADHAEWHAFLLAANLRNLENPSQRYYLGFLDGQPVATTVVVDTGTTSGGYVAGVVVEHRRKGLSGQLVERAALDAKERGAREFVARVESGSNGARVWERQGFRTELACDVFARAVPRG